MEFTFKNGEIIYPNKALTVLDELVIEFISRINVKYVIVSGYVAILFGRDRHTEDVDLFIEKLDEKKFKKFYNAIVVSGNFECFNAESAEDAYNLLTKEKSSIRFVEKGSIDPNFEVKFPTNRLHLNSLENAIAVKFDGKTPIKIGPLELQLAYKLRLGSDKDYEDAAHLYEIFRDHLDKKKIIDFMTELGIKRSTAETVLGKDVYEEYEEG